MAICFSKGYTWVPEAVEAVGVQVRIQNLVEVVV